MLKMLLVAAIFSMTLPAVGDASIPSPTPCFLEGSVDLITNSADPQATPPTSVTGNVGGVFVSGVVSGSFFYANIGGTLFTLTMNIVGSETYISGMIHDTYVDWYGNGNLIIGYQSCIP